MKFFLTLTIFVLVAGSFSRTASACCVSRDLSGWTVVTPSSDTVQIFVSSSGGNDSNNGLSSGSPVRTLAHGISLLRTGFPDELLLKCGDVWHETFGFMNESGRSASEPMLWTSYGTGARPIVEPVSAAATDNLLQNDSRGLGAHFYMIGIEFYDPFTDASSGQYDPSAASIGGFIWIDKGNDQLIENCLFHFLFGGITYQFSSGPSPQNITIRRNVIVDQWSAAGHAQGIFLGSIVGTNVVEENVFDRNAYKDAAFTVADVFNHHIYIEGSNNITVQNNIFLRCSSLSLKYVIYGTDPLSTITGMVAFNNFFYQGEVGISMAADLAAPCYASTGCIISPSVTYNVMSQVNQSTPTGRQIGWGIESKTTKTGLFDHNLMADFSYTTNVFGIIFDDDLSTATTGGNTISNNLIYKLNGPGVSMNPVASWTGTNSITNNTIQDPSLGSVMVEQEGSFATESYSGGVYSPTSLSHLATVNGSTVSYATWLTDSGETGSSNTTVSYPAPTRNLNSYATSTLGLSGVAQYLTNLRTMSKATWNTAYLAPAINSYIRAGFAMADPPITS